MRGPISEAVIIVILGFLVGGIPTAVIHYMIDSKWPSSATSLSGHPKASKKLDWPLPGSVTPAVEREAEEDWGR